MQVGVLYPRSNAHPSIAFDFLEAIKLAIHPGTNSKGITIRAENIGFGGVEKEVYEKAEKLLLAEGVDLLVAFIDQRVLPILEPLMFVSGKLLIVVNTGANYPQSWMPQPNNIQLTLNHGFLCWLTGNLAAVSGKRQHAAVSTSFYDCGYLHTAAISNSFLNAGGLITYNYVYNQSYDRFDISGLTNFLEANPETNNLLCVYDELPGSLLYKALLSYQNHDRLHLYVSPMMLEPGAISTLSGTGSLSIAGHVPWIPGEANGPGHHFIKLYKEQFNKDPGIFALLGWECGLILNLINNQTGISNTNGQALVDYIKKIPVVSPRGELVLDEETHFFIAPFYRFSSSNGQTKKSKLDISLTDWEAFTANKINGVVSGWTNTYLCY